MERFIKLHTVSTGDELWLRVEGLAGFMRKNDGAALFSPNDDGEWVVTETPEEILAMIGQRTAPPDVLALLAAVECELADQEHPDDVPRHEVTCTCPLSTKDAAEAVRRYYPQRWR